MDWVKEFYQKQSEYVKKCYENEVTEFNRQKVSYIQFKGTGLEMLKVTPCLSYENFETLYLGKFKTSVTYLAELKKL